MNEVIVERPSAHVAVIRMNRPEARNALNQAVRSGLAEHFAALGQEARNGFLTFRQSVEQAAFPGSAHTLAIADDTLGAIVAQLNSLKPT